MDLFGNPSERDAVSPFVELLWERGSTHERKVIEKIGAPFLDLSNNEFLEKERLTREAMSRGEPLIYNGRISSDDLVGEPDLLRKSGSGYLAGDIKSGAAEEGITDNVDGKPKRHYAVQLALYTDILERIGYSAGRTPFVWDINNEEVTYDLMEVRGTKPFRRLWDDYEECLSEARKIVGRTTHTLPAYSAATCKNCVWYSNCLNTLEKSNDLTLIPELGRSKRDVMMKRIPSIRQLSQIKLGDFVEQRKSVFPGIGAQTLEKFYDRAKLLSADEPKPYLREPLRLPAATTELFFDIEVDPMQDFCYLHGFVERHTGSRDSDRYVFFFAETVSSEAEKRAFADALHYIKTSQPCVIYYYSKYERTIYKRLSKKYPDVCTESDLDELFEPTRSIDLYFDIVMKVTEWPTRDFSIKTLAQYLGFKWRDSHPSGAASIEWFDRWVKTNNPEVRKRILDYNEDDCRATRVLLDAIRELPVAAMEQTWIAASHFQTKILRRKTSAEEYRFYRAGLEWNLTDPIVIENRDDIKSESRWHDRLTPYHHQVTNLITFCRRLPVTLLADDVGLGKTISAGLIISELMSRSRLNSILIVCPKLLGPQWQEELKEKFNIDSKIATGKDLLSAEQENGAVITTYHSARSHLDSLPQDRFQMLVLDEAHKLRNLYGVDEPPQVALRFRKALEERRFRFVLMLTATPIHNRLWDLYSLVELLTVARGHKNPFGSEGMFARKFIADSRDQARQLKAEAREEFRSIVYGYMSRVRRGDAKLYFPERVVQLHQVTPTPQELELIEAIAEPIQQLNALAQISILQALVSSPEALMAQLNNMARRGTVPSELAATVRLIVSRMTTSAKLQGLGALITRLKRENSERWRLVVFTTRIETQTTIQAFLERHGLKVGIINGTSGPRNQKTLEAFRKSPPEFHVIVSTEAGSEGVNLQVANVLVNYDLPWNPMIVEQRIGRVQRLASEYASVAIFNITLRGTFEEYIVGRLMEKLQMASHAIGDIDALLDAAGMGGDEVGFEEQIRRLVVAALAGKDVSAATIQAEESIGRARSELEREEAEINALLGGMDGYEYVGPRVPTLPETIRSMEPMEFTLGAFRMLGARITQLQPELYLIQENGGQEQIRFSEADSFAKSTYYAPGTPAFSRLTGRVIATGIYDVEDLDTDPTSEALEIARRWVLSFGGMPKKAEIKKIRRCFAGKAIVRVRATVAHDSYERLVEVFCFRGQHATEHTRRKGLEPLSHTIQDAGSAGIDPEELVLTAKRDEAIAEFCRFYLERRAQEVQAAGEDERKRKKLEEEFTPRLEMTLVAIEGRLNRQLNVNQSYTLDSKPYDSTITVEPLTDSVLDSPEMGQCTQSGKTVPITCLDRCQISGSLVQKHLLTYSDLTARPALPEYTVVCSLTGKLLLQDEVELSDVTGRAVQKALLKRSALSGKKAEPDQFEKCEFTGTEVLKSESATSDVSGKCYRLDEQRTSAVSGIKGHKSEFVVCQETGQFLALKEAEQCEVTSNYVRPGVLQTCEVSGKRVVPSQLSKCSATGKRVLPTFLVRSSLTGVQILESVAVRSLQGKCCAPIETKTCVWSGESVHPDDLRICELTGLSIHFKFVNGRHDSRLQPLVELLDGIRRNTDASSLWENVGAKASTSVDGSKCRVESAILSPDEKHLAACVEVRTLMGLRKRHVGFIYELDSDSIIGRVVHGRRSAVSWERN
jgi:predicted RecB family nuclease